MFDVERFWFFLPWYVFPHTRVVSSLRNSCWLVFLDRENPVFYHQCNRRDIETLNCLDTAWHTRLNISSLDCIRCQWPSDPFPFEIFLSPLCPLCWLSCVSKLFWIIHGLQWYVVLNVHRNRKVYQGRGEGGKVCGGGGEGDYHTCRYTVTTRMTSALRWAAMRAVLMFHNCEGQSHKTTACEEKGEPKRIRTEVPLLTGPTHYR